MRAFMIIKEQLCGTRPSHYETNFGIPITFGAEEYQ